MNLAFYLCLPDKTKLRILVFAVEWIYFITAAILIALISGIVIKMRRKKKPREKAVKSSYNN